MDEQITCRICLEENLDRDDVIAPCSCSGGSKWVHRECLDMEDRSRIEHSVALSACRISDDLFMKMMMKKCLEGGNGSIGYL